MYSNSQVQYKGRSLRDISACVEIRSIDLSRYAIAQIPDRQDHRQFFQPLCCERLVRQFQGDRPEIKHLNFQKYLGFLWVF